MPLMADACTLTPAAALPPLLPTPRFFATVAGRASEGSAWAGNKKPGRASASESWTKDKLLARTTASSSVPSRASLSQDWTKDKAQRKEETERVGRSSSREDPVGPKKRTLSRAPSVEVDRSEKKAKPEDAVEPVTVQYYAGPAFLKSPDPSEVPLPTKFLKRKTPKAADDRK